MLCVLLGHKWYVTKQTMLVNVRQTDMHCERCHSKATDFDRARWCHLYQDWDH